MTKSLLTDRFTGMSDEDLRNGWLPSGDVSQTPQPDALESVLKSLGTPHWIVSNGMHLRKALKDAEERPPRIAQQAAAPDPSVEFVDAFLAEQFGHGEWLLIATEGKQFWCYNGRNWEKIDDAVLRGRIQTMARERWDWVTL